MPTSCLCSADTVEQLAPKPRLTPFLAITKAAWHVCPLCVLLLQKGHLKNLLGLLHGRLHSCPVARTAGQAPLPWAPLKTSSGCATSWAYHQCPYPRSSPAYCKSLWICITHFNGISYFDQRHGISTARQSISNSCELLGTRNKCISATICSGTFK